MTYRQYQHQDLQPQECAQYVAFFGYPRLATLTRRQLENNIFTSYFEWSRDSNRGPSDPEADNLPISRHASTVYNFIEG